MSDLDPALLREQLPLVQPPAEYVEELHRGQRSTHLGISVDGRGRIELDEMPPYGRYLAYGQLWVTLTDEGAAGRPALEAGATSLRFRPIFEGGLEFAIYEDHTLVLCANGASLAGPIGTQGRTPFLAFRVEHDDIESVTVPFKNKAFGGVKELRFVIMGGDPPFAVHGETAARFESTPTYSGDVAGSKAPRGEPGRQIAIAAARQRLTGSPGAYRAALEAIVAGEWPIDDSEYVAELVPEICEPADITAAEPPPPPPVDPPAAVATEAKPAVEAITPPPGVAPEEGQPVGEAPPVESSSRSGRQLGLIGLLLFLVVAGSVAAGAVVGGRPSDTPGPPSAAAAALPTIAAGSEAPADASASDAAETPTADEAPAIPSTPSDDPVELAQQISDIEHVILDPSSPDDLIEQAGRAQQLVLRRIDVDPGLADEVLPHLDADIRASVERYIVAGREIESLVDPQPAYPEHWRIVAPPSPATVKSYFQEAERETAVPWEYLASIMSLETRMGRIVGDSSAGAQGPMQFIPETWTRYGNGGDVHDFEDSVFAAARLLRANGAPEDMANALYRYNPVDSYVKAIERYAQRLRDDERQFLGLYHWQVLYKHVNGVTLLPEGWPDAPENIVAPLEYSND